MAEVLFWVCLGVALMAFELLVPLSFASVVLGAVCIELGGLIAMGAPDPVAYSLAGVSGVAGFLVLKQFRNTGSSVADEDFVGQLVEVRAVTEGGRVRVFWRGTEWEGFVVDEDCKVGDRLEVAEVSDGGTLRLVKCRD